MRAPRSASERFAWYPTRRRWLAATLSSGAGLWLSRGGLAAIGVDEEVAQIQEKGQKAGLGVFRSSVTEHYLAIGDADDDHRDAALKLCEALVAAFQHHFQEKGFAVAFPPQRLTVVTLKDPVSYTAYLGVKPGDAVGGHYELDTNRLVIFDFRPGAAGGLPASVNAKRINTFTLIHEATHQLTLNTGLLDRQGDIPLAVSEGLAMYAEAWRNDRRSVIGMIDRLRLEVIFPRNADQAPEWIPLAKLLTDDTLFDNAATEQMAYAEAWVFVHYALKTTAMLPKFRAYLEAIRPRRAATQRLEDATAKLGNLDRLDLAMRKHARRL